MPVVKIYYRLLALKLSPNCVDAHYNFAILLAEKGQFEQAKKHYQKTLKLNPVHMLTRFSVTRDTLALG